jgi:regulatory protein SWI5
MHNNNNIPSSPGAKSVSSHYTHLPGTPPELSASSSPPPASHSHLSPPAGADRDRYFDLLCDDDPRNSSTVSDASSIGLGTTMAAHAAAASVNHNLQLQQHMAGTSHCGSLPSGVSVADEDSMLLQFTTEADDCGGLVSLDGPGSVGDHRFGGLHHHLLGKFDELEFEAAVDMFTNEDDVFFGSG